MAEEKRSYQDEGVITRIWENETRAGKPYRTALVDQDQGEPHLRDRGHPPKKRERGRRMTMFIEVVRYSTTPESTLGLLSIDGTFACYTLEDTRRIDKV